MHGGHAHLVPGQAEVRPVDLNLGVERYLAVAGGGHRGVEGDGPGAVADGEAAGYGDALAGRPGLVNGEGDVGVGVAVEEVLERRCVSRLLFFVSIDAALKVMVPLASPVGETVPWPLTWRKTPFTGTRPHMLLDRSPTVDLDASKVQFPMSAASFSSACTSICPDGAIPSSCSVQF